MMMVLYITLKKKNINYKCVYHTTKQNECMIRKKNKIKIKWN